MTAIKAPQILKFGKAHELTVSFEVLTPMFGGGPTIDPAEDKRHLRTSDPRGPVRFSGVREQLRFWWRTANVHSCTNLDDLRARESAIFGSTAGGAGISGRITQQPSVKHFQVFLSEQGGKTVKQPNPKWNPKAIAGREAIAYGAFPLRHKAGQPEITANGCLFALTGPCEMWVRAPSPEVADALRQAVALWLAVGGIGGRTRRGFGAVAARHESVVQATTIANLRALINTSPSAPHQSLARTPSLVGGAIEVLSPPPLNGIAALTAGLRRLFEFRQGAGIGRTGPREASNWPEADAIRRGKDARPHNPTVTLDKYPRAAFGMPLEFEVRHNRYTPPSIGGATIKMTAEPVGAKRWPSRLIIRPFRDLNNGYSCAAIALRQDMPPILVDGKSVVSGLTAAEAASLVPYSKASTAAVAPVLAFLDYFRG